MKFIYTDTVHEIGKENFFSMFSSVLFGNEGAASV